MVENCEKCQILCFDLSHDCGIYFVSGNSESAFLSGASTLPAFGLMLSHSLHLVAATGRTVQDNHLLPTFRLFSSMDKSSCVFVCFLQMIFHCVCHVLLLCSLWAVFRLITNKTNFCLLCFLKKLHCKCLNTIFWHHLSMLFLNWCYQ